MRALLVVGVLLGLQTAAFANDKARADKLFEEGRGYLERKEYALACTAFEQSQQADPAIGTQLNIALCYEQWGKLANAYRAYLEAEQLAKAKKDNRAKHARKKVNELAPKLAKLRISIPANADPYAIYLFDGKETERDALLEEQLLDAGDHTIEVRVAGAPPKTTKIALKPSDRQTITLELPVVEKPVTAPATPALPVVTQTPRNKRKLYAGIGLAGGGALTIGIASYVALIARSDYNDAIAMCPGNLCQTRAAYDATQDARSRANWMTVVTGAGVAMVGVGVYLVLTSKGAPVKTEGLSARPLVAPDVVGVAIGGSL
jgi:tetratricopeptide (TPR) repeat protein